MEYALHDIVESKDGYGIGEVICISQGKFTPLYGVRFNDPPFKMHNCTHGVHIRFGKPSPEANCWWLFGSSLKIKKDSPLI